MVRKVRLIAKWMPLVFTVVVCLITVISFFWYSTLTAKWGTPGGGDAYHFVLWRGSFNYTKMAYWVSHPPPTEYAIVDGVLRAKKELRFDRYMRWTFFNRNWHNGFPFLLKSCFVPALKDWGDVTLPLVSFSLFLVLLCSLLYRGDFIRWRRNRRGSCVGCGYSLVGLDGGVCPECGGEV